MKIESVKLSNVLEDIGVTRDMVNLRRHIFHLDQIFSSSINFYENKYQINCLFVGSQIEGSTTIGLRSDIDILLYTHVFLSADNEGNPFKVFISVRDSTRSIPQCCSLEFENNHQVRYLRKNTFIYEQFSKTAFATNTTAQRGPAFTLQDFVDFVPALHCGTPPDECQVLFTRPKPGHWPKTETLAKAKSHGIFLTLPGNIGCTVEYMSSSQTALMHTKHPHDYLSFQYRMSTIKTERLLMCNINLVQIKTYIFMKMIRKQFLGPIVGERLSTFYMKNSLLFTIEEFPEDLWRDENLVQCVIICLTTLRRFHKRRYCPHYTVADVNLFAEKLQILEFPMLIKVLDEMIVSELICLYELKFDDIDIRLAINPDNVKLSSKLDYRSYIIKQLSAGFFNKLEDYLFGKALKINIIGYLKRLDNACTKYIRGKFKNELEYIFQLATTTFISIAASSHILEEMSISEQIINAFEPCIRSCNISNYLKYASMLVCTKQFDRAENVLEIVERMITPDVVRASSDALVKLSELQAQEGRLSSSLQIKKYVSKLVFEVIFSMLEVNCVPIHLRYEMYKTITELDKQVKVHMNAPVVVYRECVVADAEPFLYYLQYLSSSRRETKEKALGKFVNYIERYPKALECRMDTTIDMFSHICELENLPEGAFINYLTSINIRPLNNAAYWHLFRLLGQLIYGYWTWNDENVNVQLVLKSQLTNISV